MALELFTQVVLTEDLPQYNLRKGQMARIVEHYPRPEGEEDGDSLEGFDTIVNDTIEVRASQIESYAERHPLQSRILSERAS